ncbi:MAG: DUF1631 domain-containing protein [Rubrivivax sp.]|nr:DUF1631 domain-containing protein [Rubrivivax sp.]
MSAPVSLHRFVDDELLRAPLQVEQVIEGALDALRQGGPAAGPGQRMVADELARAIQASRRRLVEAYAGSLRDQAAAELATGRPAPAAGRHATGSLSLLGEEEIAVDVEISRAVEAVRSIAEHELRELQTFISALVGDMDVARDHNPLRTEASVRALWAAAQTLPGGKGFQIAFMRHASLPLAQVLRKSYAGACARLEAAGVEPAAYRTLILPAGERRARPQAGDTHAPHLAAIRETLPMPLDGPPDPAPTPSRQVPLERALDEAARLLDDVPEGAGHTEIGRLREAQRHHIGRSRASAVDHQLVELLSRLFDTLLASRALHPDTQLLISRLQAPVLRLALRDTSMLEDYDHPVWRLVDRLGFLGDTLPPPGIADRARAMTLAQSVVDHLIRQPGADEGAYQWAAGRIDALNQHRLEQRRAAAADQIEALGRLETRLDGDAVSPSTLSGALDLAQLDTVPSDLLSVDPPGMRDAPVGLEELGAGDWLRLFLGGRWVIAQLLWHGPLREVWLFGGTAADETWAVRGNALRTLMAEGLAERLRMRSLVRRAARKLLAQLQPPEREAA